MTDWLKLSQDSFASSTQFMDDNYRKQWDADIRAFHSQHPVGSKYLSDAFKHRSRGFDPKTRTIIRKNEAAAAVALFSNVDVTNVDAVDSDDVQSVANAFVSRELLQYRLTKTLPWFKIAMSSFQEAMTAGVVCSYQYWEFEGEKKTVDVPDAMNEDGTQAQREIVVPVKDQPCIEMRPIENIRFHPSADWTDPINKSPYLIDAFPMFAAEVRAMSKTVDQKTGAPRWKTVTDEELRHGVCSEYDSTRTEREPGRADRYEDVADTINDFDTVWVHRNFMRIDGKDYVYYTLKTIKLLSDPKPVTDVYWHLERGKRPYVMGISVIESQRPVPGGLARLAAPLQAEANEIRNERRDNVKLVLNKRNLVARGKQVDIDALIKNVPGAVVMVNDVNLDVREMNWPDVTQSSYVEADVINRQLDELIGNFSGSTRQANTAMNDTLGGAKLGHQTESMMQEYVLRTWIESWCEPVLQQTLALEQAYESDAMVISLCAKKAKLWQRFGISEVTDEMLRKQVSLTVNVGMGATNPNDRLKKFLGTTEMAIKLATEAQGTGLNVPEAIKEIYSLAGMRDGTRFFPEGGDTQMQKAAQMIQQLQAQLQSNQQMEVASLQIQQAKIQSDEKVNAAKIQVDAQRIDGDLKIRQMELGIEQQRLELEKLKLEIDQQGAGVDTQLKVADMHQKLEAATQELVLERERMQLERERMAMDAQKHQAEMGSSAIDHDNKRVELEHKKAEMESKDSEEAKKNAEMIKVMKEQAQATKELIDQITGDVTITPQRDKTGKIIGGIAKTANGETRNITIT